MSQPSDSTGAIMAAPAPEVHIKELKRRLGLAAVREGGVDAKLLKLQEKLRKVRGDFTDFHADMWSMKRALSQRLDGVLTEEGKQITDSYHTSFCYLMSRNEDLCHEDDEDPDVDMMDEEDAMVEDPMEWPLFSGRYISDMQGQHKCGICGKECEDE